ncbi:MAG: hypothetical protein ACP5XB_13975 [Isosphaeraceae bacterium]
MRLTLRTLLAWLDDTLPPSQVREIGKQVSESPYARELIERIHRVSRQRRHTVPRSTGPEATDPNIVASYVDNALEPDAVAEYEKKCLTSDVNLAEVASVHQILSLLGQKVHVPTEAKVRMYHLVRGRESTLPPRTDGYKPPPPEPVTKPIQPWVGPEPPERHWLERFGPLAGCLALIAILCWSAYESLRPPPEEIRSGALAQPVPEAAVAPDQAKATTEPVQKELAKPAEPPVASVAESSALPKEPIAGIAKAETTATAPPPPAPAPKPEPVRATPSGAVGVVDKVEGILLRFSTEKREWMRLSDGTSLEADDRLACLSPFQARIVVAKMPITLLGETHLRVVSKSASDPPAIELADGRAQVDASAPLGIFKVEFSGRTVSIDRPSQVTLGLERTGKWVYGQIPNLPPALAIHATDGELKLTLDKETKTLSGPGTVLADAAGRLLTSQAKALPDWVTATARSEKDRKLGEQFLQQFSPDRPILADMVAATDSESPVTKKLAIFGVKAMQDLSLLTPILYRAGDPIARQSTTAALRWVLSQGPQARRIVREQLDEEFGVELGQLIEKLLIGYTPDEAAKKETLKRLYSLLSARDQSLVVRELAIDNLKSITGRGDLGYDPEKPDDKSLRAWEAVTKEPPKAATKPAGKAATKPAGKAATKDAPKRKTER